jgi:hypothetical protein
VTIKADATRAIQEVTTTLPGDLGVQEGRYECIHYENGTSVCQDRVVLKDAGTTSTLIDVTVTGTPTPWVTVKGVESALPTDDDTGESHRNLGHSYLLRGFIAAALGAILAFPYI